MTQPTGKLSSASSGGVVGHHAPDESLTIVAGAATESQFNTVRLPLRPVACWRVDDIRFAFDSSFVGADTSTSTESPEDIRQEMKALQDLVAQHPGCPLSIFGHADPVGDDSYNKGLSERRARAIYSLLIFKSDPDTAVRFWQEIAGAEHWGTNQAQAMQAFTGSSQSGAPLMRAYLQELSEPGPTLQKTDFIAQGSGVDRRADFQGCSEFNPLLIFSQEKQSQFETAKSNDDQDGIHDRDMQNARNRRVLALLYKEGTKVDPAKWPCPRASEGIQGCINRFWSDGDARRNRRLPDADRDFLALHDTFACRFYQRMSGANCEQKVKPTLVLIDELGMVLANTTVRVTMGDQSWQDTTDSAGLLEFENTIPADAALSLEIADIHEAGPGEAITTASGQHFKEDGP